MLINSKEWNFFKRKVRCVYIIHHAGLSLSFPCAGTSALYYIFNGKFVKPSWGEDLAAFKLPPEKNNRGSSITVQFINSSVSLYLLFCEDIPSFLFLPLANS